MSDTTDLRAQVREVLEAADKMTPGKLEIGGYVTEVFDGDEYRALNIRLNGRRIATVPGRAFESPEDLMRFCCGVTALRNLAPGVIRELEARIDKLEADSQELTAILDAFAAWDRSREKGYPHKEKSDLAHEANNRLYAALARREAAKKEAGE